MCFASSMDIFFFYSYVYYQATNNDLPMITFVMYNIQIRDSTGQIFVRGPKSTYLSLLGVEVWFGRAES